MNTQLLAFSALSALRRTTTFCSDHVVFAIVPGRLALNNAALQAARGASHPNGTTNVFFTNFSDDPWQYAGVKPLEKKHHTAGMHRCYVVRWAGGSRQL